METTTLRDQDAQEFDEQSEAYCMEKPIGTVEIPVFRLGSTEQELARRRRWVRRQKELRKGKQAQA